MHLLCWVSEEIVEMNPTTTGRRGGVMQGKGAGGRGGEKGRKRDWGLATVELRPQPPSSLSSTSPQPWPSSRPLPSSPPPWKHTTTTPIPPPPPICRRRYRNQHRLNQTSEFSSHVCEYMICVSSQLYDYLTFHTNISDKCLYICSFFLPQLLFYNLWKSLSKYKLLGCILWISSAGFVFDELGSLRIERKKKR